MKTRCHLLVLFVVGGCSLYVNGKTECETQSDCLDGYTCSSTHRCITNASIDSGLGSGSAEPGAPLYQLTFAHSVSAEAPIHGVDADQQGGLWIAYSTDGSYQLNEKPLVTLVHWDPTTRQRLQTFTYQDLWSPVSGLAIVQGQIWLNYKAVADGDQVISIIDPSTGAIVRTLGTTGLELAALGDDRVLVSAYSVLVVDAATGGETQSFASPTVVNPNDPMGGISFSQTQQGIAWRPGEIWVGSWYLPGEIFDESGNLLGTIDLTAIQGGSSPMNHLAFDRGQLLVGSDGQLTWYSID